MQNEEDKPPPAKQHATKESAVQNVLLLTVSYACGLANATTVANTAPIIATDLLGATDGVATLSVGILLLGSALVSPFGAAAMKRFGRRPSFMLTCAAGTFPDASMPAQCSFLTRRPPASTTSLFPSATTNYSHVLTFLRPTHSPAHRCR